MKNTNVGLGVKRKRDGTPNASPTNFGDLQQQRRSLPISSARRRFLEETKQNDTVVLVAETGSGKSTQTCQYLLESEDRGLIAVTQPRRVAAVSLAQRVGLERGRPDQVGYRVRFEDSTTPKTKIIFQTDGMLLRETLLDPTLSKYSWIIIDEAHERTVNTDILIGLVKRIQELRNANSQDPAKKLKVMIMSATLDAEKFARYFRNCPILFVRGRTMPINVRHVSNKVDDYLHGVLQTTLKIHRDSPAREDILVFLTGQEEIENTARSLKMILNGESEVVPLILPLYAAQSVPAQRRVFIPSAVGQRKIILATNIAETSLTIPGVKHVVDSCRVKAKIHQASTGLDILSVVKISKSQGFQRAGRAGRESEGHVYRMLTKHEFDELPDETVPEIKRTSLATVILQLMAFGVDDIFAFNFIEQPDEEAVRAAFRQLQLLGAVEPRESSTSAVDKANKSYQLTPVGKTMSAFPLDPMFTKAILIAKDLGCSEEVITIVSLLSSDTIVLAPVAKREEARLAQRQFSTTEGDHISLLKIFRAYKQSSNKKSFCDEHYIHKRNIHFADEIRTQLMGCLERTCNTKVTSCGENTDLARKAFATGLFTNIARLTKDGHYITLHSTLKAKIHPTSVLCKIKPSLIVFTELQSTQQVYLRNVSVIDSKWLLDAHPKYFKRHAKFFN